MTIEEKAKAYDEAIKKAKDMLYYKEVRREDMEYLFPELKEREDERIKNIIKHALNFYFEGKLSIGTNDTNYAKCLAWLEKQGKPIDINPSEFDLHLNRLLKQFETLPKEKLASSLSFYLNVVQNNGTYKQDEQKPAEWSEEDESNLQGIIDELKANKNHAPAYDLATYNRFLSWLKSLKDRVQPKQEWSEEDEEMYKEVLTDIIYAKNDMEAKGCLGLSKRAMEAFNWFGNRLKSLRPQNTWKPSDEQMDALHYVTNFDYGGHKATLVSLYEQLKKLKE